MRSVKRQTRTWRFGLRSAGKATGRWDNHALCAVAIYCCLAIRIYILVYRRGGGAFRGDGGYLLRRTTRCICPGYMNRCDS